MKKKASEKLISQWSVKAPLYIDKSDKRYSYHTKMLKECGFSDTETWSLYSVIAEFALPRLKRLKKITPGHPCNLTSMNEWHKILDKIIFAFEWAKFEGSGNEAYFKLSKKILEKNLKKYTEGMKLFTEYFRDLWW